MFFFLPEEREHLAETNRGRATHSRYVLWVKPLRHLNWFKLFSAAECATLLNLETSFILGEVVQSEDMDCSEGEEVKQGILNNSLGYTVKVKGKRGIVPSQVKTSEFPLYLVVPSPSISREI